VALACAMGCLSGRTLAGPAADSGLRSPPTGDFTAVWMDERIKANGLATAMRDDDKVTSTLLKDPSSIYSTLADVRKQRLRGAPWTKALQRMDEEFETPMTDLEAKQAVAWDLGLTHALPGLSAGEQPVAFAGDALVQAHLIKAGVSVDIFQQAIRLFGAQHYAVAAYYAVAVQVLRDRVPALPEARRRASGLREMVGIRFIFAERLTDIGSSDWAYLSHMLESEMSGWHAGRATIYGHREIPVAFRVARVAAAYRQFLPYVGPPPCDTDGAADRRIAAVSPYDASRELCLSNAIDRAVHAWFRRVLESQLTQDESHHGLWPPELAPALLPLDYARSGRETMPHGELFARHAGHTETADRLLIEDRMRGTFSAEEAAEVVDRHMATHLCAKEHL
jgi:hypothetical protein